MLTAAYLGFAGARKSHDGQNITETVVHTADWGCGAFKNNEKVITAIQYLAARMAGVKLVLHAVGLNPNKTNYTEEAVDGSIQFVNDLIEKDKTPNEILKAILEKSKNDTTWSMK